MIVFKRGDIFDSECPVLVNPVNTDGIMGKGLAKQFADRYPGILAGYKASCGDCTIANDGYYAYSLKSGLTILCVPTKIHWRNPSSMELVSKALKTIESYCTDNAVECVAMPALGCGEGGLDERDVAYEAYKRFSVSIVSAQFYLSHRRN